MLYHTIFYIILLALGVGLSLLFTPMVKDFAHRKKWYDVPNERSSHTRPVARIGGIAIISAFTLTVMFGCLVSKLIGFEAALSCKNTLVVLGGGLFISCVGFYDDLKGVRAIVKLFLQFCVAVFAVSMGLCMDMSGIFSGTVLEPVSHICSFGLSVIWIVAIMNSVNLMDGLDGLAGGVSIIAMSGLLVTQTLADAGVSFIIAIAFIGSLIGFLYHNYHPATIFMGDTGSLFLGFVLATFPLPLNLHFSESYSLVLITLCPLYLPVFDMTSCAIRRISGGTSPFAADNKHLHHRILLKHSNGEKKGYRRTIHRLYGIASVFTLLSIVPLIHISGGVLIAVLGVAVMTLNLLVRYHYLDTLFLAIKTKWIQGNQVSAENTVQNVSVKQPSRNTVHTIKSEKKETVSV